MYKRFLLFTTVFLVFVFSGCKKGSVIEAPAFTKITVESLSLSDVSQVAVFVNNIAVGELNAGSGVNKLLPRDGAAGSMTLTLKDATTGELYLDSVFEVQHLNAFRVLINNALGIRQFMKDRSDNSDPIPTEHIRIQLVNKIMKNGVKKKVTFKLFRDSVNTFVNLKEIEKKFENVGYEEMSEPLDIELLYYKRTPSPVSPKIRKNIHVQALDAITGEILVDISPEGILTVNKEKHSIVVPIADEDPQTSLLNWTSGIGWARIEL
ncbi:MAG: hypothetical protein J7578_14955 [Chitinophagaceae bacterium]|nr:hypothetical protein [Chitinophagaceae bacterium]